MEGKRDKVEQEMQEAQNRLQRINQQINQLDQQRQQVTARIFQLQGKIEILDEMESDDEDTEEL